MIVLSLAACAFFAIIVIIINALRVEFSERASIASGVFIVFISLVAATEMNHKQDVHRQKIEHMGTIIADGKKELAAVQKVFDVHFKSEKDRNYKMFDEIKQNYAEEVKKLQQKAIAAGLGAWKEEVIVPAKIKKVFRFKNEPKDVTITAEAIVND